MLPNIDLAEQLNELRLSTISILGQTVTETDEEVESVEEDAGITFVTERVEEASGEDVDDLEGSDSESVSDEVEEIEDSSDAESRSSADSIARNADFIAFNDI